MTDQPSHETIASWTLPGSDGQPIYGNTHLPRDTQPHGMAIISHGFMGYKDYGFLPRLASHLSKQSMVVHRFNFSHSGMTNKVETFEKPELFERNTWNRMADDLQIVADAAATARLPPIQSRDLPQCWIGHSRGGITTLLTAGRAFAHQQGRRPQAIITLASGDACCRLSREDQAIMLEQGYMESPSGRTGQRLRVGKQWLTEQLDDPANHDLPALVKHIRCPLLILHGQDDDTVPPEAADHIASAATAAATVNKIILPETTHSFNAPNPLPADAPLPEQTRKMFEHVTQFVKKVLTGT